MGFIFQDDFCVRKMWHNYDYDLTMVYILNGG